MLAQVVVDDERILALPHEVLAHRAASERRQVPERRWVLGRDGDHDAVLHRAFLFEDVDHLGDRRRFLADGDIDADQVATALVDDRVEGDGRLARLAVADDQLALPTTDGNHGVDGLDARLDRRVHR